MKTRRALVVGAGPVGWPRLPPHNSQRRPAERAGPRSAVASRRREVPANALRVEAVRALQDIPRAVAGLREWRQCPSVPHEARISIGHR